MDQTYEWMNEMKWINKKVNEFFDFMLTAAEKIFYVFRRSAFKWNDISATQSNEQRNIRKTKGRRERAMKETQMLICYVKVVRAWEYSEASVKSTVAIRLFKNFLLCSFSRFFDFMRFVQNFPTSERFKFTEVGPYFFIYFISRDSRRQRRSKWLIPLWMEINDILLYPKRRIAASIYKPKWRRMW